MWRASCGLSKRDVFANTRRSKTIVQASMNYTKPHIEKLQAEACLAFLSVLDGIKYKLGDRLDSQKQKSAPDFAFQNEIGQLVGIIEVTSSAEYQRPRTEEDQFEFE